MGDCYCSTGCQSSLVPSLNDVGTSSLHHVGLGKRLLLEWCMQVSKDQSRAYCVRSSVHLAMASTVEAQTAEQAKSLSKIESWTRSL